MLLVAGMATIGVEAAALTSRSYVPEEVVRLSTNGVPVLSGWDLPVGTVVRLDVQGDHDFLRWIGDVPAGVDATSRTIDVVLGEDDVQIVPLFRGMWLFKDIAQGKVGSSNVRTGVIECTSNPWRIRSWASNEGSKLLRVGIGELNNVSGGELGEMDSSLTATQAGRSWIRSFSILRSIRPTSPHTP